MKRFLPLSACALLLTDMSAAHAMLLNPNGLGQALIYPYYTVNKEQDTLVTIANTSDRGKAAIVTFREGRNGRSVLQFHLFLAAHDKWTGAVTQSADAGGAMIRTADTSCATYGTSGSAFSSANYDGGSALFAADGGSTSIERTREGLIEVVAEGDVVSGSALDAAITPTGPGIAPKCTPSLLLPGSADLVAPSNELSGSAAIISVGEGTLFGYDAVAIAGFTDRAVGIFDQDYFDPLQLGGSTATPGTVRANVVGRSGVPITLDYAFSVDAVSALFMAESVSNDFLVNSALGAQTDWVVAFPTKAFYTDPHYVGATGPARAPFAEIFGKSAPGEARVTYVPKVYNPDGAEFAPTAELPASLAYPSTMGYEVNVLSFSADTADASTSAVLGSSLLQPAGARSAFGSHGAGWIRMDLATGDGGHALSEFQNNAVVLHGLPATGFMVYNIINAHAQPGILANYGGAFAHRSMPGCVTTGATACP
jgi:hypothetical protein